MNDPEVEIAKTVADYVRAVRTADVALLRATFREDARMWGFLGDVFISAPIQDFFAVVEASSNDLGWVSGYGVRSKVTRVAGPTASAVLEESGYAGSAFVNHFTLVHEANRWRIATKTFTTTSEERTLHVCWVRAADLAGERRMSYTDGRPGRSRPHLRD